MRGNCHFDSTFSSVGAGTSSASPQPAHTVRNGREPHAADWQGRSYILLDESTYTHTPSRTSESILQLTTKILEYPSSFPGKILGILLVLFLDSLCQTTRMITIKPRPRSGVFLESTNVEAFGVSPGQDRVVKETMDREVIQCGYFCQTGD